VGSWCVWVVSLPCIAGLLEVPVSGDDGNAGEAGRESGWDVGGGVVAQRRETPRVLALATTEMLMVTTGLAQASHLRPCDRNIDAHQGRASEGGLPIEWGVAIHSQLVPPSLLVFPVVARPRPPCTRSPGEPERQLPWPHGEHAI
jgi:hypothetical protein